MVMACVYLWLWLRPPSRPCPGQWCPGPAWDHRPVGCCCARPRPPHHQPPPAQQSDQSCPIATSTSSHTNLTLHTHQIFLGLKIFKNKFSTKEHKIKFIKKSEHFGENFHYRVILTEPEFKQDTLFKLTAREQKSVLEIEDESKY